MLGSRGAASTFALAIGAALAIAGPVVAKETIDPNTLNPPPPDFFNAVCNRTGSQIICTLAFSDPTITDEPSGVICDGTELRVTQDRSVVGKRYYDADGNLLVRHFREAFSGSFKNPDTGNVATFVAHDTVIHRLGTPGEIASGFTSISGQSARITAPGGGTVLVDAGRVVIDESSGEIVSSHGPHHFDDYFAHGDASALQPLCDALA